MIELLAVIVILAIIALIVVPIILNIIDSSKNSSNQRSVELYGKAVENAVGRYQMKHPEEKEITITKLEEEKLIEYKGNKVVCNTTKINSDGTVYLSRCKVDNKDVSYTYGEEEYTYAYMWYTGEHLAGPRIGGDASNLETSLPADKNYYLKFKLNDTKKVTESYACAVFNRKKTCVRGGSSDYYGYSAKESEYTGNMLILKGLQTEGFSCYFSEGSSHCYDGSVILYVSSNGYVSAYDDSDRCDVFGDGGSRCASL